MTAAFRDEGGRRGPATGTDRHGGVFLISLDFELHWGVRDHLTVSEYRENLLGARRVVPRLLEAFGRYGVHATWAVVGALMTETKSELERRIVAASEDHAGARTSPRLPDLRDIGDDEATDPYHFAPTLVRLIAATPHQEIATHTFSHFYCLAPGQTAEDLRRDLRAAITIAEEKLGRRIVSVVFPRNQVNEAYLPLCRDLGLTAYRGTEESWLYRPGMGGRAAVAQRALRLVDAYVDLSGPNVHHTTATPPARPLNLPSSRFLRPYSPSLRALEPLRIRRVTVAMRTAARTGRAFHLWWHPHNFGTNERENLEALTRILDCFVELRAEHGMRSLTMEELAREHAGADHA